MPIQHLEKTDHAGTIIPAAEVSFRKQGADALLMKRGDDETLVHNAAAAFPLTNPDRLVVLRDESGTEIGILDDIHHLDPHSRALIGHELERSYFMPEIRDVENVEIQLNIVNWEVHTDRGPRIFQVKNPRRNTRKIGRYRLIIRDVDGNRYEIKDYRRLDSQAQRLVEEFL